MAVTCGFYNSLNGDRKYNAEQMSAIFDGVITDGVFGSIGGALMTIAGEGMQVLVKTGKAWFNSTWTLNDAQMALPIDTADVSLTRIDAVVLEVNSGISTRENSIKVIKGTPSANPVKPTMASDEDLHQYALAYVTVAANATSITAANIEVNVGKTGCPFVTSVLQQTSITDLFAQWEAEFDTWFDNVQAQLAGDVATNLQLQIDALKIGKTAQKQYGLTSTYPNDYIEWLGKYNEYWWRLLHGEAYSYTKYVESKTAISGSQNHNFTIWSSDISTTIYYSKSISVDENTGAITMVDPQELSKPLVSTSEYDKAALAIIALAPCYISGVKNYKTEWPNPFYIPEGARYNSTISTDSDGIHMVYLDSVEDSSHAPLATYVQPEAQIIQVPAGETTYEHSTDRNAYPDSGTVDGITYTYLGRPFEKFPTMPQIETGSYIGTGTYGDSSPNRLTFEFMPKFVQIRTDDMYGAYVFTDMTLVRGVKTTVASRWYHVYDMDDAMLTMGSGSGSNSVKNNVTWGNTFVEFYALSSSVSGTRDWFQMNASGRTYHYIAIG